MTARVAAIVLAAGSGSRMGAAGKLLLDVAGRPLVCRAVAAAAGSRAAAVLVVLGHDAPAVGAAVRVAVAGEAAAGRVRTVENPAWRDGLAGSLRAGIEAVGAGVDGVVVVLGDMPRVGARHIDRLIEAFAADGCLPVCVPVHGGRRGNPVLWPARFLPELSALEGDVGGRVLLRRHATDVREVEMPDAGVLFDVDVPTDLARAETDVADTDAADADEARPRLSDKRPAP